MKVFTSCIILLLPFLSVAQTVKQQDTLVKRKPDIQNKISSLQDSLREIEEIKPKELIEIEPAKSVARNGGKLFDIPHHIGKVVMELKGYTPLKIIGYEDYYYKVCVKDTCGYLVEFDVAKNIDVLAFKDNFLKKKKEREAKQKEEEKTQQRFEWQEEEKQQNQIAAKKRQEEEKRMIEKYGQEKVDKMKEGQVWIGMNEEQAIFSLGRPKDVNRRVGSWGTKEQWVYNGFYVYFENGSLTAWSD